MAHIKSKQKKEMREREKRECTETGNQVVKKERSTPRKSWGVCLEMRGSRWDMTSTVKLLQTQWNQPNISKFGCETFYTVDHFDPFCWACGNTVKSFLGLQAMVLRWWDGSNHSRMMYIMNFGWRRTHTSCVGNKVVRAALHQISMSWSLHCKRNWILKTTSCEVYGPYTFVGRLFVVPNLHPQCQVIDLKQLVHFWNTSWNL